MKKPKAKKRDTYYWGKIDQKKEGHIEVDNREKDCILLWGIPLKKGREGEESQVVIVKMENIEKLITILQRCQK